MRYVPISCIRDGMIVAKSMYNTNNKLLLRAGYPVRGPYIDRIQQLGYQGIYVEDDLSEGIEIKDIVSDELRSRTAYAVKDLFTSLERNTGIHSRKVEVNMDQTKMLIDDIVYDIMNNRDAIVNMVDIKIFDEYTFFHSVNVAILSMVVASELGLTQEKLYNLGLAAVLHDIGKVYVDKNILNKNGKLTDEEYRAIKMHSEYGYRHLKSTYEIPTSAYIGVLQHHERFDGTGYPLSKRKEEISLFGRIICIADVYDAITSNRPYRTAMLPSEAMEYIMANAGTMFDDRLVRIFVNKIAAYPVGTGVRLSSGELAIVTYNNKGAPLRPVVKVYSDLEGNPVEDAYELDLSDMDRTKSLTITEIIA